MQQWHLPVELAIALVLLTDAQLYLPCNMDSRRARRWCCALMKTSFGRHCHMGGTVIFNVGSTYYLNICWKQLTFAQYPLRSYHHFDPAAVGCLPAGTRATFREPPIFLNFPWRKTPFLLRLDPFLVRVQRWADLEQCGHQKHCLLNHFLYSSSSSAVAFAKERLLASIDIVVERRKDLLTNFFPIFFSGCSAAALPAHTIIDDSPISKTGQVPGADIQEVRDKGKLTRMRWRARVSSH